MGRGCSGYPPGGTSKPEPKIYYIHERQSLTLNAANVPHGGVRAGKGGGGVPRGLGRAIWRYTALYRARHRVALGATIGGAVVAPVRYMVALDGTGWLWVARPVPI